MAPGCLANADGDGTNVRVQLLTIAGGNVPRTVHHTQKEISYARLSQLSHQDTDKGD